MWSSTCSLYHFKPTLILGGNQLCHLGMKVMTPPLVSPSSHHQKSGTSQYFKSEWTFFSLKPQMYSPEFALRLHLYQNQVPESILCYSPLLGCVWMMTPSGLSHWLRLRGLPCLPHQCVHCGDDDDWLVTHGLSCRWSQEGILIMLPSMQLFITLWCEQRYPSHFEPTGLLRSDSKRPDGMSIVHWWSGKLLVWDATCSDTFSALNIGVAVTKAGAVAEKAKLLKMSPLGLL